MARMDGDRDPARGINDESAVGQEIGQTSLGRAATRRTKTAENTGTTKELEMGSQNGEIETKTDIDRAKVGLHSNGISLRI